MTLFDLFFILCFLASAATLAALGIRAIRRRPTTRLRRRLLVGWLSYAVVLLGVSLLSPQRFAEPGAAQCADDWCLTLVDVVTSETSIGREYTVRMDLTNRGRGRPQRERFVSVYLVRADGQRVDPIADASAVPFDTLLTPGNPVRAVRRFRLPADAPAVAMVVAREGLGRIPGCCIIADDNSFWHKPTLVRLGPA